MNMVRHMAYIRSDEVSRYCLCNGIILSDQGIFLYDLLFKYVSIILSLSTRNLIKIYSEVMIIRAIIIKVLQTYQCMLHTIWENRFLTLPKTFLTLNNSSSAF